MGYPVVPHPLARGMGSKIRLWLGPQIHGGQWTTVLSLPQLLTRSTWRHRRLCASPVYRTAVPDSWMFCIDWPPENSANACVSSDGSALWEVCGSAVEHRNRSWTATIGRSRNRRDDSWNLLIVSSSFVEREGGNRYLNRNVSMGTNIS